MNKDKKNYNKLKKCRNSSRRRSSPRGKLEPELLAHYVGEEPPHECGRLLKYRRELQIRITQLARERSPPPGCAYLSEVVTQIQTGSSRTDSPVRILYAQPRSRLKLGGTADWTDMVTLGALAGLGAGSTR